MKFILAFISLCDKDCAFDCRNSYIAVAVTIGKTSCKYYYETLNLFMLF